MSKLFWTVMSAAKELALSKRQLLRYCIALGIKPAEPQRRNGNLGGNERIYIFSVADMDRLRQMREAFRR